jgi:YggT family protein
MTVAIIQLLDTIVHLIIIVLIVNAVLSWLIAFQILNPYKNAFVRQIWELSQRLTDPLLRPIRKIIPPLGGVDLSPIILLLGLQFLMTVIKNVALRSGALAF